MAKRYGVNRTAQVLRLEHGGPRKRAENQVRSKAKSQKTEPADFLEFLAPGAKPVTNCSVEVESVRGGKLRLELKSIETTELIQFHQQHSGPVMAELDRWLEAQLAEKKAEPNSGLGQAITYLLRHLRGLTAFLHEANAPLDNNLCERALNVPCCIARTHCSTKR